MQRTYLALFAFYTCLANLPTFSGTTADAKEMPASNQQRVFQPADSKPMHYLLSLPEGYNDSKKEWPLILFLHGAGERGSDITKVAKHGPPKLVAEGKTSLPFIIVSPQCPAGKWWSDPQQLKQLASLIAEIETHYRVDQRRIYLTGLSMGGYGTWHLAGMLPKKFAAIAPICGGGKTDDAKRLSRIPIWVFHGARDGIVPLAESERMVDAVKAQSGNVRLTVYPKAGHDSWSSTYANPELYRWFLRHQQ